MWGKVKRFFRVIMGNCPRCGSGDISSTALSPDMVGRLCNKCNQQWVDEY